MVWGNFLDSTVEAPDEGESDQVSSVNAEIGAESVGKQRLGGLETKGNKTLYNVGDSFMALYAMRINA